MNQWIENIRRWISQTVLSKIITEIDNVNKSLAKLGSLDLRIGPKSRKHKLNTFRLCKYLLIF